MDPKGPHTLCLCHWCFFAKDVLITQCLYGNKCKEQLITNSTINKASVVKEKIKKEFHNHLSYTISSICQLLCTTPEILIEYLPYLPSVHCTLSETSHETLYEAKTYQILWIQCNYFLWDNSQGRFSTDGPRPRSLGCSGKLPFD